MTGLLFSRTKPSRMNTAMLRIPALISFTVFFLLGCATNNELTAIQEIQEKDEPRKIHPIQKAADQQLASLVAPHPLGQQDILERPRSVYAPSAATSARLVTQDELESSLTDFYAALVQTSTDLIVKRYIPNEEAFGIRSEINQLVFILYDDDSKSMETRREILKRITRLEIRDYLQFPEPAVSEFELLIQATDRNYAMKHQYFPAFLTALYAVHGKRHSDTKIWYPRLAWLMDMVTEEKDGKRPENEPYFIRLVENYRGLYEPIN